MGMGPKRSYEAGNLDDGLSFRRPFAFDRKADEDSSLGKAAAANVQAGALRSARFWLSCSTKHERASSGWSFCRAMNCRMASLVRVCGHGGSNGAAAASLSMGIACVETMRPTLNDEIGSLEVATIV